jgi:uncharacterized protein (DUF2164 family)
MQLKLDFSSTPKLVDEGKKTERITFTASSDLKLLLEFVARRLGKDTSMVCREFVSQGIKDSIGDILLTQSNLNLTIGELLKRG